MKKIPFRKFQQRGTKFLDDLPIALTRYGRIVAYVGKKKRDIVFIANGTEKPQQFDGKNKDKFNDALKPKYLKKHAGRVKCKHDKIPMLCKYYKCRNT